MDRPMSHTSYHKQAMSAGRAEPLELLLHTSPGRKPGEPGFDEKDRQNIYKQTFLWVASYYKGIDQKGLQSQSQTCRASYASYGHTRGYTGSTYQQTSSGTSCISISFEESQDRWAGPGVVCRYYVHTDAAGSFVSHGDHGLVQQICPGMAAFQQSGKLLLCRSFEKDSGETYTGHIQHRSGISIHEQGFYRSAFGPGYPDQHGWTWPGSRQHLYRTSVVEREVRRGIPQGLRDCCGSPQVSCTVFYILQHRTQPSEPRRSDTERNVPGIITMCPSPRGEGGRKNPSVKEKKRFIQYTLTYAVFCPKDGGKGVPPGGNSKH